MRIIVNGTPKEIAALVLELQERQEEFVPTHGHGLEYEQLVKTNFAESNSTDLNQAILKPFRKQER